MKKLIRLKPLNPFFFGTNKTFSDETLHDVSSSYFPQQTHLFGMLRFFILQSEGKLKLKRRGRWVKNGDFKEAFSLVGGFDKNNQSQTKESFGKIKSLSPVFIVSTNNEQIEDFHFLAPKDTALNVELKKPKGMVFVANKRREKEYRINNYNPKNGYINAFTTSKFWKDYASDSIEKMDYDKKIDDEYLKRLNLLPFDSLFKDVYQVGIKRDSQTKTVQSDDEGSFYTKTSYTFADDSFEFAFVVDFEGEFKEEEAFVYLGAERSAFKLKIEDYSKALEEKYPNFKSINKHIALSDIHLNNFDDVEFMINDGYIAHAHMNRTIEKQGRASSQKSKSAQEGFIPRGSVLYFKDDFDTKKLDSTIGYNIFIQEER